MSPECLGRTRSHVTAMRLDTLGVREELVDLLPRGWYLDSTTTPLRVLGALSQRKTLLSLRESQLSISTCERLERYTSYSAVAVPDDFSGVRTIRGTAAVVRRLIEISAGVRSRVIGERFVFHQVRRSVEALPAEHPMRAVGRTALATAAQLRADHGLRPAVDYEDLSFDLLGKLASGRSGRRAALVLVGGGMLARAIATHRRAAEYAAVIMVTRSPKRLRRRLAAPNVLVCRLASVDRRLTDGGCDVVLATSGMTVDYRAGLLETLASAAAPVLDLCAVPLLDDVERPLEQYLCLYDPEVDDYIAQCNARVTKSAKELRRAAGRTVKEIL